jgi:hypothetical protein
MEPVSSSPVTLSSLVRFVFLLLSLFTFSLRHPFLPLFLFTFEANSSAFIQVIRSPISTAYKLNISLLERLMSHPSYSSINDAQRGVTYSMLTRNFRNHPSILRLPNDLFYRGELVPCAPSSTVNTLVNRWSGLPNPSFPIVFHSVKGKDEREGRSPSFFNVQEITTVKMYVEWLQHRSSGVQLRDCDIGASSSVFPIFRFRHVLTSDFVQVSSRRTTLRRRSSRRR